MTNEMTRRMIRGALQRLIALRRIAGWFIRPPLTSKSPGELENAGRAGLDPEWRELSRSIWP